MQRAERSVAAGGGTIRVHLEGVFRNHRVIKGRNRDTAWFAITDDEWPAIRRAFQAWLAPANFDRDGVQKRALRDCFA